MMNYVIGPVGSKFSLAVSKELSVEAATSCVLCI